MKVYVNELMKNPFLQLNQAGPVLRIRYRNYYNREALIQYSFSLDFYRLWSRDYLEDQGEYSGSHTKDYAVYKDEIFATGVTVSLLYSIDDTEQFWWFAAAGATCKWIERHYSVEGTYDLQVPSGRTEQLTKLRPKLQVGLRYYF
jgi:hypothetical protein